MYPQKITVSSCKSMKHLVPISNVVAIAHGAQEPSLGDGKGVPGDPESRHWSLFHICVSPATLQRKGKDIVGGTENSCSPIHVSLRFLSRSLKVTSALVVRTAFNHSFCLESRSVVFGVWHQRLSEGPRTMQSTLGWDGRAATSLHQKKVPLQV